MNDPLYMERNLPFDYMAPIDPGPVGAIKSPNPRKLGEQVESVAYRTLMGFEAVPLAFGTYEVAEIEDLAKAR